MSTHFVNKGTAMTAEHEHTVYVAFKAKPKMGAPCNNCGWCCLIEVCPIGAELTGSTVAPCKLLVTKGDKHYCPLATDPTIREILFIGVGCDAQTVEEQLERLIAC